MTARTGRRGLLAAPPLRITMHTAPATTAPRLHATVSPPDKQHCRHPTAGQWRWLQLSMLSLRQQLLCLCCTPAAAHVMTVTCLTTTAAAAAAQQLCCKTLSVALAAALQMLLTFSSMKLRQPSMGTKAAIFLPFLISCTRAHLRMAELGCLASIPLRSSRRQNSRRGTGHTNVMHGFDSTYSGYEVKRSGCRLADRGPSALAVRVANAKQSSCKTANRDTHHQLHQSKRLHQSQRLSCTPACCCCRNCSS
jgi:hypothetical protein